MFIIFTKLFRGSLIFFLVLFCFIANGQSFTLKIDNSTDSIQWQSSTDNSIWSDIKGGNTATVILHPTITTYYRARTTSVGCAPIFSDVKAAVKMNDTLIGAKLIKGQVVLPQGSTADVSSYSVYSLLGNTKVNVDGSFQLLIVDSTEESLLLATNALGDVVMAADFIGHQDNYQINSESTALSLLLMYPFLKPIDASQKQQLITDYKAQTEYAGLISGVEAITKMGVAVYSPNNVEVVNSVIALTGKSYNDDRLGINKPLKRYTNSGLSAFNRLNNYYFGTDAIEITTNGTSVTIKNKTSISYAGGIYKDNPVTGNPILMESFLLDGSLLIKSKILKKIYTLSNGGTDNFISTGTYDFASYPGSNTPGTYYIHLRNGRALDLSDEDFRGLRQNISTLAYSIIGNIISGEFLFAEITSNECFQSLIDLQVADAKIAFAKNPQADYFKDIALPVFIGYTNIAQSCSSGPENKLLSLAFSSLKIYQDREEPPGTLRFSYDWISNKKAIDACKFMDANDSLFNCFSFQATTSDNFSQNSCDTIRLGLQAVEDPKYYPYLGNPVKNVDVTWRIINGGGVFAPNGYSFATGKTDENGMAMAKWVLPSSTSQNKAGALSYMGQQNPVEDIYFDASSTIPTLTAYFTPASGNQKGISGKKLSNPLGINIFDQNNALVSQDKYNITWNLNGNGSLDTLYDVPLVGKYWNWTLGSTIGEQVIEANIQSKTCNWQILNNPLEVRAIAYDSPQLTTFSVSAIDQSSGLSGGKITRQGGYKVISNGVCWSTTETPTITDSKTSDLIGSLSFASSLSGLQPNQLYYVRAYLIDSSGTYYGNQVSFTTLQSPTLAVLTTADVSSITLTSAITGGNITDSGGLQITARGVCWSKIQNPTIADSIISAGTGAGSFISNITGLDSIHTYHIRAFATNSMGTSYGNDVSFTTLGGNLPAVTTINVSAITATTVACGGKIASDGGSPITAKGICWSTSPNPTIDNNPNVTNDGTDTASFVRNLAGLAPNTKYYLRAYATNSSGTGYGNQITFTTPASEIERVGHIAFVYGGANYTNTVDMILTVNNGIITGTLKNAISSYTEEVTGTTDGTNMTLVIHTNNNYVNCKVVMDGSGYPTFLANIDETYTTTGTTDANLSFYNATFQYVKSEGNPLGSGGPGYPCSVGAPRISQWAGTFTW